MQVQKGSVVSIEYTLTNDDGAVIDASNAEQPLGYLHGFNNLVIGLEEALEGATAGSEVKVTVPPEKGYGMADPKWVQKVPRASFEGVESLQVGMSFVAETEEGPRPVFITGIEGDTVEVDGNHPLAGQTLHFAVKVASLRESTAKEREQGGVEPDESCQKPGCCD